MAKKNYKKFLPKAGSTIAVALAMSVALSTQVQATELDDNKQLPGGIPPVDENVNNPYGNEIVPVEHNAAVEQENDDKVAANETVTDANQAVEQSNSDKIANNAEMTEGALADPDLPSPDAPGTPETPDVPGEPVLPEVPDAPSAPTEPDMPEIPDVPVAPDAPDVPDDSTIPERPVAPDAPDAPVAPDDSEIPDAPIAPDTSDIPEKPDAPDAPNTNGMGVDEHNAEANEYNEAAKDYNGDAKDYNDAVEDYNEDVKDYNELVDDYNEDAKDYNDRVDDYNEDVKDYNDLVGDYNKDVADYQEKAENYNEAVKDYNDQVNDYNDQVDDYNDAVEDYNTALKDYKEDVGEYNGKVDDYNEAVEDYNEAANRYNQDADTYEKAVEAYNKAVEEYNAQVDAYLSDVEAYNQKVDAYNTAAKEYDVAAQLKFQEEMAAFNEAQRLHGEAATKYAADQSKQEKDAAADTQYQQQKAAYETACADYQAALEAYEASLAEGGSSEEARAAYHAQKVIYDAAHAAYRTAVASYNDALTPYDTGSEEYQTYLEDQNAAEYLTALENYNTLLAQYKTGNAQYQTYLANKVTYDAAYAAYLDALYAYNTGDLAEYKEKVNQANRENAILQEVNQYNQQVKDYNDQMNAANQELEDNIDVGVAEDLEALGTINQGVDALFEEGDTTLDTLRRYDEELAKVTAALEKLEKEDSTAALGSAEYAAYLKAVEDYNDAVDVFNAYVKDEYNEAVRKYNAKVDAFNASLKDETGDSTLLQPDGAADWGNYAEKNMTFNHLDVRYDAADVKDKTVDEKGNVTGYSDVTSKYDVVGVYYDEAAADANPNEFGINYTNTDGKNVKYKMVKDDEHNEFGTASKKNGQIDRTDADADKNTVVTFYATLDDGSGELKDISVTLNKNSVYAENSYVKYDKGDYLHLYKDSDNNGLNLVEIDGVLYYDVSGKPVYLISSLVCDGYNPYGGYFNMGGLDLILNMETMIEIHQAANAQKLGFKTYELEKYKAVDEENLTDPDEIPDPGNDLEKPSLTPVSEPGTPAAPVLYNPGQFTQTPPTAPQETEKLAHITADTLEKLEKKVVIEFADLTELQDIAPIVDSIDFLDPMDYLAWLNIAPSIGTADELDMMNGIDYIEELGKLDTVDYVDYMNLRTPDPVAPPADEPMVLNDSFAVDFEIEIPDEEVPLAAAPKTGDISSLWGILSGLSAAGMFLLGRKRRDEE